MTLPRLITVCGTGEIAGDPQNMLSLVRSGVTAEIAWTDVVYPASISLANPSDNLLGVSETASRAAGVTALRKAVFDSTAPVILSGYSLGALVVSDFLEQANAELAVLPEILAVVNIANPARRSGESYGHPSFGSGLDGEHGPWPYGLPVYEIANPVDMITSAPPLSPWRRLAVVLRNLSLADLDGWFAALIRYLPELKAAGLVQNWTNPEWWQAYAEAPAWLRGYLIDGQHTLAYGQPRWTDSTGAPVSGIDLAARVISWRASLAS